MNKRLLTQKGIIAAMRTKFNPKINDLSLIPANLSQTTLKQAYCEF